MALTLLRTLRLECVEGKHNKYHTQEVLHCASDGTYLTNSTWGAIGKSEVTYKCVRACGGGVLQPRGRATRG